jgi:hypothetical protein
MTQRSRGVVWCRWIKFSIAATNDCNRPEVLEHRLDSHRQTALVVVDAYARVSLASNHVFSGHHSR